MAENSAALPNWVDGRRSRERFGGKPVPTNTVATTLRGTRRAPRARAQMHMKCATPPITVADGSELPVLSSMSTTY